MGSSYDRRHLFDKTGYCPRFTFPSRNPEFFLCGLRFLLLILRRMKSLREEIWFEVPARRGLVSITPEFDGLRRKRVLVKIIGE